MDWVLLNPNLGWVSLGFGARGSGWGLGHCSTFLHLPFQPYLTLRLLLLQHCNGLSSPQTPRFDSGCIFSQDPAIAYVWPEKSLNDDQRSHPQDTHSKGLCLHSRNAWNWQNIHCGACCEGIVNERCIHFAYILHKLSC